MVAIKQIDPRRHRAWPRSITVSLAVFALAANFVAYAQLSATASTPTAAALAFRDAAINAKPGYRGPVFKLNDEYPTELPPSKECAWLDTSLEVHFELTFPLTTLPADAWTRGPWCEYIKRILNYVKEGQDPDLADATGFKIKVNGKTRWHNVPWMAVDPTQGREFVHGTTNERTAHLSELIGTGKPSGSAQNNSHFLPNGAHFLPGTLLPEQSKIAPIPTSFSRDPPSRRRFLPSHFCDSSYFTLDEK